MDNELGYCLLYILFYIGSPWLPFTFFPCLFVSVSAEGHRHVMS